MHAILRHRFAVSGMKGKQAACFYHRRTFEGLRCRLKLFFLGGGFPRLMFGTEKEDSEYPRMGNSYLNV